MTMDVPALLFSCDLKSKPSPFPHKFEHTVGSGHATLALRADWQRQLARCNRELGFQHVRFHGLLSDDVGTLVCQSDKLVYSFFNSDQIFDFLLSIGMRPFVELSFMPSTLSSGGDIVFHYRGNVTPPKDYSKWATLIRKLVQHWADRYGHEEVRKWYFEVWNEPNLKAFWTGSQADYFKLYKYTSNAVKEVDPLFRVGGPATASNSWVSEFLDFCDSTNTAADFVSTHHYPTDAFGQPGDDTIAQLAASHRSVLREEASQVKEQARGKPVYYTEWCTSSNPFDDLHDLPYAAAFVAKTVMESRGLVEAYSYWTFSDIFEENYFSSAPFHGGFGLMNIYGIPKPAYRAYQMLHQLGDEIFTSQGHHETVDLWVTRKPGFVHVLVTNGALPRHQIKTEQVKIELKGLGRVKSATLERIDETHANARAKWVEMGSPDSLTPGQVATLEAYSSLTKEFMIPSVLSSAAGEVHSFEFAMPVQAVALLALEVD